MTVEAEGITSYKRSLSDKIVETAMTMFLRDGVRAVRMDDISSALSISKRTLYELYRDKETLLHEGVRRLHERKHDALVAFSSGERNVIEIVAYAYKMQLEYLKAANPLFFTDIGKYPAIQKFFDEQTTKTRVQFKDFIARGIREGYFRPDLDVNIVAAIFESVEDHFSRDNLHEQYPVEVLFSNIILTCIRGMCTPEGVHLIDSLLA